jgi:hypothetical protein
MYDGSGYPSQAAGISFFFPDMRRSNLLVCSGQNNGRGGNLSHRGRPRKPPRIHRAISAPRYRLKSVRHFQSEHLASPPLEPSLTPWFCSHHTNRLAISSATLHRISHIQTQWYVRPHLQFSSTPTPFPLQSRVPRYSTDYGNRRKHPNNDRPTCASPRRRRRRWVAPRRRSRSASRRSRLSARYGSVRSPFPGRWCEVCAGSRSERGRASRRKQKDNALLGMDGSTRANPRS